MLEMGDNKVATPILERRASPRIEVNGKITYRIGDSSEFLSGEIESMNVGGALIWVAQKLPVDSRLLLRLEPKGEDETIFQLEVVVLCKLHKQKNSLHGYACRIELG